MAAKVVSKPDILHLYRRLLRVGIKWPFEQNREGRNLREYLVDAIQSSFRKHKSSTDQSFIKKLYDNGKQELQHLNQLLSGKEEKQVRTDSNLHAIAFCD